MGNSLTIISRKEKEELYKDLEGKWLIELDGNKIENIDDFAVAIMNEIDMIIKIYTVMTGIPLGMPQQSLK